MAGDNLKHCLEAWGPKARLAYVRWTPSGSATQTLTEAQGVASVARTGAGAYTITLKDKCKALVAFPQEIENDTTHYHVTRVESSSASAGTIAISHKSVAFASVASGPSASDTVDEIEVLILMRMFA